MKCSLTMVGSASVGWVRIGEALQCLIPVPVTAATVAGIFYCFSLCKAIRNNLLISVCFCLPSSASRMSASVRLFSFMPMWVVLSFIHWRFASLSAIDFNPLLCYTCFAQVRSSNSPPGKGQ